jgi:hypothetical protein
MAVQQGICTNIRSGVLIAGMLAALGRVFCHFRKKLNQTKTATAKDWIFKTTLKIRLTT